MPRKSRKIVEGKFFHVMIQGYNKEYIFDSNQLKTKIKNTIFEKAKERDIKIIAYCIMDNHVHLLVKAENNVSLSKMMAGINTSYAKYYNYIGKRVGYVFRDRYRAEVIFNTYHLQNCIKYIHENPVKAKMVEQAKDYNFSSIQDYLAQGVDDQIEIESFADEVEYMDNISGVYEEYNFIDIDNEYGEQKEENFDDVVEEYKYLDFTDEKTIYDVSEALKKRCRVKNEDIYNFMGIKRTTYYDIIRRMKFLYNYNF